MQEQLLTFPNWSSKIDKRSTEQFIDNSNGDINSDSNAANTSSPYENSSLAAAISSIDERADERVSSHHTLLASSHDSSKKQLSANDQPENYQPENYQPEQVIVATTNELLESVVGYQGSSRAQVQELLTAGVNAEQDNDPISQLPSQSLSQSVSSALESETDNKVALASPTPSTSQSDSLNQLEAKANSTLDAEPISNIDARIASASASDDHSRNSNNEYAVLDKIASTRASAHQDLFDVPASKVSLFEQRYQSAPRQQLESIFSTQPAKLMSAIDPRYPSVAKRKGIELDVQVNFIVDEFGRVTNIEFEQQSKLSYFRSAIINAIEQWRFEPALNNGEPVDSKMSKIFSFSMS